MANNRELSQFGSFISVNDTTKEISIASTITQVNAINLNVSGVSTLGIVSSLYVTGITTVGFLTGTDAYFSGIVTAYKFVVLGPTSLDNLEVKSLNVSGITTLGVTSASDLSVYQLKVSGISTFINGPVFIGTETSTGTASQPLQVTGGVYVSGNIGIGTTTPTSKLHVQGDALVTGVSTLGPVKIYSNGDIGIVTATSGITTLFYYGNGSKLTNIKASSIGVSPDATSATRYIPFVDVTSGDTTVRTSSYLTFNPSTCNLGIGLTNPQSTLHILNSDITKDTVIQIHNDPDNTLDVPGSTTYRPRSVIAFSENLITDNIAQSVIWYGNRPDSNNFSDNDNSIIIGNTRRRSSNKEGGVWFAVRKLNDITNSGINLNSTDGSEYGRLSIQAGLSALGNFGIGTDFPEQKLHVAGDTYISGNLGIGTTSPKAKLDVQGDVKITGISTFGGDILPSTTGLDIGSETDKWDNLYVNKIFGSIIGAASSIGVSTDSTNATRYLPFVDVTTGLTTVRTNSNLVYNPSTQRLGIGTTNPQAALDVGIGSVYISNGDIHVNGTPFVFNTRNGLGGFWSNGGTNGSSYFNNFSPGGITGFGIKTLSGSAGTFGAVDTNNMYYSVRTRHNGTEGITDFSGLVGIGTTAPTSKLHVQGDALVTGISTLGSVKIYSNGNNTGIITSSGLSTVFYYGDGSGLINLKSSAISGGSSISINLNTDNQIQYLTFAANTGFTTAFGVTTSGLVFNPSNNSLGIGTTTPLVKDSITVGGDLILASPNTYLKWAFANTDTAFIKFNSTSDNTPPSQLEIAIGDNGDATSTGRADSIVVNQYAGGSIARTLGLLDNYGNTTIPERLGIGTTAPSTKLHVQGNVRITGGLYDSGIGAASTTGNSGQVLQSVGTGISWVNFSGSSVGGSSSISISTNTTNQSQYLTFVPGAGITTELGIGINTTSIVFNPYTGNLGIGTTNPKAKLHVSGGDFLIDRGDRRASLERRLTIGGARGSDMGPVASLNFSNYDNTNSQVEYDAVRLVARESSTMDEGGELLIYTTGAGSTIAEERVRISDAGNVGIGTSTPTSKLHVEGDLLLTGISTLSSVQIYSSGNTGIVTATSVGSTVFYYGDGSGLINLKSSAISGGSSISISSNADNQAQYLTFAPGTGSTTGLGVTTTGLVFNPSTTRLGIGTATPSSNLHVEGNTLVTGISTLSSVKIYSNGNNTGIITSSGLSTVFYYGDGSGLINLKSSAISGGSSIAISANNNDQTQYLTFAPGIGSTTGLGVTTTNLVFNPSTSRLGIGTTTPASNLHVQGDILVTGVSTLGTVKIYSNGNNTGIITSSGLSTVFYYGDGSGLTNLKSSAISGGSSIAISSNADNQAQYLTFAPGTGSTTGLGVTTTGLVFNPYTGNLGIGTTSPSAKLYVQGDVLVTGVSTLGSVKIFTSGTNGIVTSSNPGVSTVFYYGDGSNLKNIPASAFTGEIGLGTNTYGEYVKNILGTANEIEFSSSTTGESATVTIGLPNDVTIGNDLTVNRNLYVSGNITVSGSFGYLNVNNLQVKDKDIILGITTDSNGNDVSKDLYANHGGIAIASTEGTPLVSLQGIGNSLPDTYKQIMWLQKNASTGLGTDAWVFNYGVGIGSTQIANGVRLAVGKGITMSDDSITAGYFYGDGSGLTKIKASSISGASTITISANNNDQTQYLTFAPGTGSTTGLGVTTTNLVFNPSTARLGIGTATPSSNLHVEGNTLVTGISTLSSVKIYSSNNTGIITSSGVSTVFYYGDGSGLTNLKSSAVSGGSTITISSNTTNQTQYLTFAAGIGSTTGLGVTTTGLVFNPSTTRLGIGTTTPTSTLQVQGDTLVTGISTLGSVKIFTSGTNGIITATSVGSTVIYYGDGSNLTGTIPNTITNIDTNAIYYPLLSQSTSGTISSISVASTSIVFNPGPNYLGIGTTDPKQELHVKGSVRITGALYASDVSGVSTSGSSGQILQSIGTGISWVNASTAGGGSTISISTNTTNQSQYLTYVTGTGNTTGFGVSTTGLVFNPSTGNLGLGTATPTARLSVANPNTGNSLLLVNDNLSEGSLFRVSNSAGNMLVDVDSSGTVLFPTSGNVGIGTTLFSPTTKLHVDGDITARYYYGDGSKLSAIPATNITPAGSSSQVQYNNNGVIAGAANLNYDNATGNVGIGTSIPTARLSVANPNTGNSLLLVNDNLSEGSLFRVSNSVGNMLVDVDSSGTVLFPTSGNVGIGTTLFSPTTKLHVDGDITARYYYGDGSKLSNLKAAISAGGTTGQVQFNNAGSIEGASYFNYDSTNVRVGIGTSVPTARLSVSSPTSGNSLLLVNDNLSDGSLFRVSNSAGQVLADVDSTGTVLFPTSGNVGIGSTISSPTTKLEVGGDVTARYYYGDGSNLKNLGLGGIGITNTNLSTTVYPTLAANTTSGIATVGIATTGLSFTTDTNTLRIGSGDTISGSTNNLLVGSAITMYGSTGIISATKFYGDGSNIKNVSASAGGTTGQIQFNNGTGIGGASYFHYDSTNVRVGIGTSVPTARLSVSSPTSGNSLLLVNDNLSDGSLFRVSNSAGIILADVDSSGTILFPTSGNVGIGSTISSPTSKLEVGGDVTARYYYGDGSNLKNLGIGGIGITNQTSSSTAVYPTLAANTTSGIATVGIATTGLSFTTDTNTLQVGIAVTPIVMYGNTGIISATRYYGDGSYLTMPAFSIAGTTGQVLYNNNGQIGAAANLNYNTTTGNVGIGTTLATARLSVANPNTGNSLLLVNDNLSDGSLFRVSNSAGIVLADVDSGGTILFPTAGNIGIGTTLSSPTEKLHVVGNALVTGNLTAGGVSLGSVSKGYYGDSFNLALRLPDSSGTLYIQSPSGTATWATFTSAKLSVSGSIEATGTFTSTSDVKLKTNIQTIPNALDKVLQLRGVEFDRIDIEGEHQIGVIAQEVEKVIPEVVYGKETKSVAYGNLVGVLIEAIKEQQTHINNLSKELENLKNK